MAMDEFEHMEFKINYKGRVHFQEWYKMLYNFLLEKGYTSKEQPGDPNFEDYVLELINSNGSKNNWVWWRTSKKIDDLFTYEIELDFQVLLLKNIEVMHHGKKLKVNDGETNTFIRGKLLIDADGVWGKSWFTRELFDLLRRKQINAQISVEKKKLYDDVLELHDRAKQALGCLTVKPREAYHIDDNAFPDV